MSNKTIRQSSGSLLAPFSSHPSVARLLSRARQTHTSFRTTATWYSLSAVQHKSTHQLQIANHQAPLAAEVSAGGTSQSPVAPVACPALKSPASLFSRPGLPNPPVVPKSSLPPSSSLMGSGQRFRPCPTAKVKACQRSGHATKHVRIARHLGERELTLVTIPTLDTRPVARLRALARNMALCLTNGMSAKPSHRVSARGLAVAVASGGHLLPASQLLHLMTFGLSHSLALCPSSLPVCQSDRSCFPLH